MIMKCFSKVPSDAYLVIGDQNHLSLLMVTERDRCSVAGASRGVRAPGGVAAAPALVVLAENDQRRTDSLAGFARWVGVRL
jgi:hypothetical protein